MLTYHVINYPPLIDVFQIYFIGPLLTLYGGSAAYSVLTPKLFSLTRPPCTKSKKSHLSTPYPVVSTKRSYKIYLENIGKWRVLYKLGQCISNFIDRRKLYGFMVSTRGIVRFMTALPPS